jgi:hypothetical protein
VQVEPGTVIVAEAGAGKYAQRIDVPGHTLRADEPAAYGGDDTGPSRYDRRLECGEAGDVVAQRGFTRELDDAAVVHEPGRDRRPERTAGDVPACSGTGRNPGTSDPGPRD